MPGLEIQITFDAADPDALAEFWRQALGYALQDPPAGFESWEEWGVANHLEHLAGTRAALVDPDESRPRLFFQKVPEPKTAKNRLHIDIHISGGHAVAIDERRSRLNTEAERLVGLGATKVGLLEEDGQSWVIMNDPEGNEFCLD
ncbi:MAG TPA: VOC family protein [Chloroflexota bacterium]|nr:VOC family protein [Chloroflexota bacterium]